MGPDVPQAHRGLTHHALLYESAGELVEAALAFVRSGLAEGDVVQFVSFAEHIEALRSALTPEEADRVSFEETCSYHARPAQALARYQELCSAAAVQGRRVRVLRQEPIHALPEEYVAELHRIDAAINELCSQRQAALVCAYERALRPDREQAVHRNHSNLIEDGRRRESQDYTDPASVLADSVRGPPLPSPPEHAVLLESARRPAEVRAFVSHHGGSLGLDPHPLGDLVMAVHEVAANAMTYATLESVRMWKAGNEVLCDVVDHGPGLRDPLVGYRLPDDGKARGRGLWIARLLTDLIEVRSGPEGSAFRIHASNDGEEGC